MNKPRIKRLPPTGDADRFMVDGKIVAVSGGLVARTNKHPLALLGEMLKQQEEQNASANETALMQWVEKNAPLLYASLCYCCTADDMRRLLNEATGLAYLPGDDMENAFAGYLMALQAQKLDG